MTEKIAEFSERLRRIMEERGLTQSELAQLSGVSKSSISRYLSGAWKAKQDTIYDMARVLQVSEAWLMGYDVSKERTNFPSPTLTEDFVRFRVNTDIAAGYNQSAQPLEDWGVFPEQYHDEKITVC